ncbi:processed acidic surface protein [Bacillus swezeyi]|uniref:Processed acidic surface protein n=1 Tax=Bacillus swezeyi TaxID=1925020 RepID=A0A1R1QBF3_9BACI|nr:processed acidic surface protein [Bacillus swezeyi]MEC1262287.1 processed acidic surface protein [Bacillus swezeyi]MED2927145.1 processed acidic surface protein [Bacillus swezeyi]MED2941377.1 processed acidic surface protein [Bacillus swezeyi]MED2962343.1 processed acidic surface protein [Bacillus swezeyi]MED2979783.1 processed acidic surface protein [Bacillus swezeyi]
MKKRLVSLLVCVLFLAPAAEAFAAPKQAELNEYLEEIGITEKEMEAYLQDTYDESLRDFDSVEELRDFLGERLTEKLLASYLKEYGLSEKEAVDLFVENGYMESGQNILDVFVFEYELDDALFMVTYEEDDLEIGNLFQELGVDDQEWEKLVDHLRNVRDKNPNLENDLMALGERLEAVAAFESVSELSAQDIAEMLSVLNDVQKTLEVKTKYYLVKDGKKKAVTLTTLVSADDLKGASLLVEVYDLQGHFILDVLLTPEMIGSDLIHDTGAKVKQTKTAVKHETKTSHVKKTVKGAKLPKTAGHYAEWSLLGVVLMLGGFFLIRRLRKAA